MTRVFLLVEEVEDLSRFDRLVPFPALISLLLLLLLLLLLRLVLLQQKDTVGGGRRRGAMVDRRLGNLIARRENFHRGQRHRIGGIDRL